MEFKTCSTCGRELPATAEYFHRDSCNSTGFHCACKECRSNQGKEYYKRNKEKKLKQQKEWRKNGGKKKQKEYYEGNKGRIRKQLKEWREKQKEKYGVSYSTKWREENKMYEFDHRFSNSVRQAIYNDTGGYKWENYVDYTWKDLKGHLESQFEEGMTWRNYGEWHLDHIIPKCNFYYEGPEDEDFKECWRLENLQPLWAQDSWEKAKKMEYMT